MSDVISRAKQPKRQITALSVVHYPYFGGPQNQVLRLDRPLAAMGVRTIAVLPEGPGEAAGRLRAGGVEVVTMPLHRLRATWDPGAQARFVWGFAREIGAIRRLIRERGVDVVQVNGLVNPHAAIAARLEGVPVVWQLLDTRPPMGLRRVLMPVVRELADVVMSAGMRVAELHPGAVAMGERLVPFYPPVDTEVFRPDAGKRREARERLGIPMDAVVVGTVANLTPMKGHRYLLEAGEIIGRVLPEAWVVMLGGSMETQGEYEAEVRGLARQTRLWERGRLVMGDPGREVALYLQAFDVFAMTSVPLSEGIPTTVLEAMASGIPVVTTDVGSVREAVKSGETGEVVAPLDTEGIAAAVLRLLQDKEAAARIGAAARREAEERFDANSCAATHLHAYETAIAHSAHSATGRR